MKNLKTQFAVLLLSAVCLLTGAYGQLTPSGDSYTNTAATTTNYGAQKLLDVESTQTTFIQFDLTAIPAGYTSADITKASLKLYVNAVTTAGSFNVDYVNGTWTESTLDASNAPALGTTIAASVPLITKDKNQYILVDITAAVQAWLSGTPNDGIALVANSPLNASFDSKENTTTSHPAELDIVFAGGGTLTGITTASGSGLTGGGTSGTLNLSLTNACSANQVLQYNGSSWVCAAVGTGTVTSVGSGAGLTGGPITGSGTLSIAANACASGSALSALPFTCSPFATLGANTFTGNQTVSGNLSATGLVTGSGYQIGSNLFDYGSYANQNAFLGFAGNTTMTGIQNTASGYQSLLDNVTGSYNTASGYQSLLNNTTGNFNTASGYESLAYNTTGAYNTALGEYALANNQTGGGNIGIGWDAGATVDGSPFTGSQNTALGYGTKFSPGSLSNATAIGSFAEVSESNAIVLGSFAASGVCQNGAFCSNTNVGIGTSAPTAALDVVGNSLQALIGDPGCGSGFAGIGFVNKGGFNSCSNYALLGDVPGNLYINSSLSGKIYFRNNNGTLMTIDTAGVVSAKGGFSGQCVSSGAFDNNTGASCNMDLAEAYASAQATEAGDLVALVPTSEATVRKSSKRYEPLLLGVVSTNPGLVFDNGKTHLAGDNSVAASKDKAVIALAGRVPVKVSIENGAVHVGDPLTSSSHPGVAMKATAAGKIIGYALAPASKNGKVLMFVQPGYYAAPQLDQLHRENLQLQRENKGLRDQVADVLMQVKQQQSLLRAQSAAMRSLTAEVRETRETLQKVKAQVVAAQPALVAESKPR